MSGPLLDLLRDLARAEQEYACAEMIDETSRQQSERAYWAGEIERLREAIEQRDEGWSGVWEKSA